MIWHNNMPIEAVYSSSSGGVTEDSENAWGSFVPYLRSVQEINETTAREWTRSITLTQLNTHLQSRNINIGSATGIRLDKNANGRVQEMTILGTAGNHTVRLEPIRSFFTPSLDSRNFTISGGSAAAAPPSQSIPAIAQRAYVRDSFGLISSINLSGVQAVSAAGLSAVGFGDVTIRSAFGIATITGSGTATTNQPVLPPLQFASTVVSTGYNIEFVGRGWGHGVGMSQHGAHGMAQMGMNFRQILMHYYTNVEVR